LTSAATIVSGNTTSTFYEVTGAGAESGSAAGLYSSTVPGSDATGWSVKISFGPNPQPILTSAFLKASNEYLWWDASDLALFNSGEYDSITLWNKGGPGEGIGHNTGGSSPVWKFHGTSHAGLNGSPGTSVPDGGFTLALLGMALIGVASARRLVCKTR